MKQNYIIFVGLLSTAFAAADTLKIPFNHTVRDRFTHNNFAHTDAQTAHAAQEPESLSLFESFKKNIQNALPKPEVHHLSNTERFNAAYNSVVAPDDATTNGCVGIIDMSKVQLLENNHQSDQTIFNKLFGQGMTQAGTAWALDTIAHPTADVNLIQSRQKAIETLAHDNNLCDNLAPIFANMSRHDRGVWHFWHTTPLISNAFEKSIYFSMPGFRKLNTSTVALEADKYLTYSLLTFNNIVTASLPIWLPIAQGIASNIPDALRYNIKVIKNLTNPILPLPIKLGVVYMNIVSPLTSALILYSSHALLANNEVGIQAIHSALNDTAMYVAQLKKIADILNQHSELLDVLPDLQHVRDLFVASKHSAQFNKLLSMLATNTFAGEVSFIRMTGRVKAAYKLIKECKDEFLPAFAAAGELEGTLALAQLINNHTDRTARYCLAEFVDAQKPQLAITDFWNPLVDPATVVTNSVSLGGDACQNIILTGPNTGGKTTIIKSLVVSLILAQTFGIAPASSCILTPFAKINCFMDIQDNIAAGTSLFKAEINRAKELVTICKNCAQENGFVFTIMDEVFTSTSPKEGEAAAYQFIEKLGTFDNGIAILATHYPKLTELEAATDAFANHHVEVVRNADNSLTRTFKLKNGPSFMNIASDILHDEGIFDA